MDSEPISDVKEKILAVPFQVKSLKKNELETSNYKSNLPEMMNKMSDEGNGDLYDGMGDSSSD